MKKLPIGDRPPYIYSMVETGPRIARESRTIEAMVRLYCRGHHGAGNEICHGCRELLSYAGRRLGKCPYGEKKPACSNCPIHCYNPEMRERIRAVMRYVGPRMLWRHPVLAVAHLFDSRRKAPVEAVRKGRREISLDK
jgi:hypothetical protein